jgi:hypothetical protein
MLWPKFYDFNQENTAPVTPQSCHISAENGGRETQKHQLCASVPGWGSVSYDSLVSCFNFDGDLNFSG